MASTTTPYSSSEVSKPPRSANSTTSSGSAASRSSSGTSDSVSMSTTVSGVPSSWASKPRSATCRNGMATSRSKRRPSGGTPSSSGTSSSRSTSEREPPTRVTVAESRSRMTAQASWDCTPRRAAAASEAGRSSMVGDSTHRRGVRSCVSSAAEASLPVRRTPPRRPFPCAAPRRGVPSGEGPARHETPRRVLGRSTRRLGGSWDAARDASAGQGTQHGTPRRVVGRSTGRLGVRW